MIIAVTATELRELLDIIPEDQEFMIEVNFMEEDDGDN